MDITNEFKPILMRNFYKSNLECKGLKKIRSMTVENIIKSVEKTHLIESGVYAENVADKWIRFNKSTEEFEGKLLVAGINNNDNSLVTICLLEEDAVSVFEGMAIAGQATNIFNAVLYIPKERDILKQKLEKELENIDLAGFQIKICVGKIDVSQINEGVLIHHIETLASISALFNLGEEYVQTKIISVTGSVKTPGTGEVTINSNIKKIIQDIAEGTTNDVKAIVVGGKTGRCITELETENEKFYGYGMNEIIVLNNKVCVVDFAKQGISNVYERTCGRCTFCREGSYQLRQILIDATEGKGKSEDIELLEEIANEMSQGTFCSLGKTGSEFIKSSLKLFKSDYEAHIKRKNCLVSYCEAFSNIAIMGDKCNSCGECKDVCEYDAIEGKKNYIYMIDEFECTKCGKCIEVCPNNAIVKTAANKAVGPDKLTRVGKWKKGR